MKEYMIALCLWGMCQGYDTQILSVPNEEEFEDTKGVIPKMIRKPPTYRTTNTVEKVNQNMPTAGTGGHFCSMLDDIEHLPEHAPFFNEFPVHDRNMNFVEFADILSEPYNSDSRTQKRTMSSDLCYYTDTSYCGSNIKSAISRTCSMSSDDQQLESMGELQYNNSSCSNENSHNTMKQQFNVCHNTDRMCNSNDLLCNNSDRLCNNVDRMCNNSDRMCNNQDRLCNVPEAMCNNSESNTNRIYSTSPPESPDLCKWRNKHPENWNPQDVLDWLFYTAEKCDLDCGKLRAENFRSITGSDLCKLSLEDFERIETVYGRMLYSLFKELRDGLLFSKPPEIPNPDYMDLDETFDTKRSQKMLYHMNSDPGLYPYNNLSEIPRFRDDIKTERSQRPYDFHPGFRYGCGNQPIQPMHDFHSLTTTHQRMNPCGSPNGQFLLRRFPSSMPQQNRCTMPDNVPAPPTIQRRRPGRPRIKSLPSEEDGHREKKAKNQHLWEFIYEVLMNPMYNPQYVRWENQREGVFRFVQSEAVAQLWGSLKNNDNMTYEKLSRAMRHYYKRGILDRVEGRRLVYKFSRVAMDRVREKRHSI